MSKSANPPEFDASISFTDTSVLITLVDEGEAAECYPIFTEGSTEIVTTPTVREEFKRVCERHDAYHGALLKAAQEGNVDEFDMPADVDDTENDWAYIGDLLVELEDEPPVEVVKRLKEKRRRTRTGFANLFDDDDALVAICNPGIDPNLLARLKDVVDNEDDGRVLTDASMWAAGDGSGMVITHDNKHMVSRQADINQGISEIGAGATLRIMFPDAFLQLANST